MKVSVPSLATYGGPAVSMMVAGSSLNGAGQGSQGGSGGGADKRKSFDYKENEPTNPKQQHRAEIEKALEEYKAAGNEIPCFGPIVHIHYLFVQQLRAVFEKLGIHIEDPKYKMVLDPLTHLKDVHGNAPRGGLWNLAREEGFEKDQNPTVQQVMQQLSKMSAGFGI